MKKKLVASLLCVAMAASMMMGCSSSSKSNEKAKTEDAAKTDESKDDSDGYNKSAMPTGDIKVEEASAEKIEVKEEVPKRKTPSKKLEDTIEFEKKLVHDEEGADEILNNYTSDNAIDSDNDIFNLIDSMYDEEEK